MFCRNCGKELDEATELCPECGMKPLDGDKFCSNCGVETRPGAEFCVKCGARLTKPDTGEVTEEREPEVVSKVSEKPEHKPEVGEVSEIPQPKVSVGEVSQKSRLATALLAFFLGQFGAHRFYLGKIGTAVVMLILGILGYATVWFVIGYVFLIPVWIWALVDFIFAVAGLMKDREGKPIKNW